MNTIDTITVRFNDGQFFASAADSELEGAGETLAEALRDLADVIETVTI